MFQKIYTIVKFFYILAQTTILPKTIYTIDNFFFVKKKQGTKNLLRNNL